VNGPAEGEGDNLWSRLRRRKVVQWGIAYAAGAWGFLQGLAYVSSLLNWPAQLQKLTGLALLIGLPVALVLAWYHGDRGEQRIGRTELAILTLLFLLGVTHAHTGRQSRSGVGEWPEPRRQPRIGGRRTAEARRRLAEPLSFPLEVS
jgi:hypothetical protein